MNYYYFAAALPTLSLESRPTLSFDEFRSLCREHLCRRDLDALDDIAETNGNTSRHPFVRAWRGEEQTLRNTIAGIRAARLKIDASTHLREPRGFDSSIERTANDAFAKDNPLDREMALDKFRWGRIEDLAGYEPFEGRSVLAYALKLILAERWALMSEEEGGKRADQMIEQSPAE